MQFYTIGVFGSDEQAFFNKLGAEGIDLFIDIRQRRGVRGREYAFVNSNRLQKTLAGMNIRYMYRKDLAPTAEVRQKQKEADKKEKVQKRVREALSSTFIEAYQEAVLQKVSIADWLLGLQQLGCGKAVLFCVEKLPKACHRHLVSMAIEHATGQNVKHL